MKRIGIFFSIIAAALLVAPLAFATDFNVHPNMSNASFTSSAPLETINGTSSELSGSITVDLGNPSSIRGNAEIATASLRTGVDTRDKHLQGEDWLNASENPQISFEVTDASRRGGASKLEHGKTVRLSLTGELTINGVTKTVTVPAQATYYVIKGSKLEGTYGIDSNILRVTSSFDVQLDDFDISIAKPLQAKVSNTIELEVRLTGVEQSGNE